MKTVCIEEQELTKQIVQEIQKGEVDKAVKKLRQQAANSSLLPPSWLLKTADALEHNNWSILSEEFINMDFIGKNGYFLIIAPYRISRQCQGKVTLSAIYGKMHDNQEPSIEQLEHLIREKFGNLNQPIPVNLSFTEIASCGNVCGESGEAFIVPNGWPFPNSVCGPALNNAKEQRRRFSGSSRECIQKIFEYETANLLLSPLEDEINGERYRHVDTQVHEAGHASGLGFSFKDKNLLFQNYSYAGVEEWRADSLGFEFAACTLPAQEAGKLVAVNFCIRFGLDAHRLGGLEKDTDVYASLVSLEYLFQNDAIYVTKNGQLALRNLSYPGLLQAVELHRAQALSLTRRELNLKSPTGIFYLYKVDIHPSTQSIFQALVMERCQGLWAKLQ
ncbi:McnG protein [Nostoc sp. NIES-2111]|nr:McnG protein [Nostoc sp. NIES-2111]